MRRGRALQPHPEPADDGCGDLLWSRPLIAELEGVHPSAIRRGLAPVACHVPTRAYLYRESEVAAWLSARRGAA